MFKGISSKGLELTEEEAFALLELAMTSPQHLDAVSETAIHKLAGYCRRLDEKNRSSLQSLEAAG